MFDILWQHVIIDDYRIIFLWQYVRELNRRDRFFSLGERQKKLRKLRTRRKLEKKLKIYFLEAREKFFVPFFGFSLP